MPLKMNSRPEKENIMKKKIKVNPQEKSTPATTSNTKKVVTIKKLSLKSKLNWCETLEVIIGHTDLSASFIARTMTSQTFPQDWEIIDKSRCGLIDLYIKIHISSAKKATLFVEEHSDYSYWGNWKKDVNYYLTRINQLSNSKDKGLIIVERDFATLVAYHFSVFFNSIDELKQKTILLKKYISDMSIAFGQSKGRKYKSHMKPQS